MTTSIGPAELLTEVRIPLCRPAAAMPSGKWRGAMATTRWPACVPSSRSRRQCTAARLAACGVAAKATRLVDAEAALVGSTLDEAALEAAGQAAMGYVTAADDRQASAAYRRTLVATLVKRTARAAAERAGA